MSKRLPPQVILAARRQAFEASLTDESREALAQVLKPDSYIGGDEDLPYWKDPFISSLAKQHCVTGYLSPNQMHIVLSRHSRWKEDRKIIASLKPLKEGETVERMRRFGDASITIQQELSFSDGAQTVLILRWVESDGRRFKFSTSSKKSIEAIQAAREANEPVILKTKVKWLAPDSPMAVLGGVGSSVKRVLE
jgi:hypothetical protein